MDSTEDTDDPAPTDAAEEEDWTIYLEDEDEYTPYVTENIDRIVTLLERYSPGYMTEESKGSSWEIESAERAFGRTFPPFYRHFLEVLGNDTGALFEGSSSHTPDEIYELYLLVPKELIGPNRFLFIIGDDSMEADHYFLDLERPAGPDDFQIVRYTLVEDGWKRAGDPFFNSLNDLLHVWTVRNVAVPSMPLRDHITCDLSPGAPGVADYVDEMAGLGFTITTETDGFVLLEYPGAVLLVLKAKGSRWFFLDVGMTDPDEWRAFQEITAKYVGKRRGAADAVNRILTLLERYSPGYTTPASGSPFWEIEFLERAFGHPLPAFYRRFLAVLGNDTGRLFENATTHSAEDIHALYLNTPENLIGQRRYLFVFSDDSLEGYDFYLDLEQPAGPGDFRVVRYPLATDAWKNPVPSFNSLNDLLHVWTVRRVAVPSLHLRGSYGCDPAPEAPGTADYLAEMAGLGFTITTETDGFVLLEHPGAVLLLLKVTNSRRFFIDVGISEPDEWRTFQAVTGEYIDDLMTRMSQIGIQRVLD